MAFPSVRSSIATNGSSATASPVVSLPATVRAGDTLYVQFRSAAGGSVTWPAGWTVPVNAAPDVSTDQVSLAWKKADGSESGTTITLSAANQKFAAIAYAVKDATDPTIQAPELSTVAVGTSAGQPNATTVTPTGGSKDYLWLTLYSMEGEQTGVTTYPTNYASNQVTANSGTAGVVTVNVTMAGATRTNTAASEDAGAWVVAGTLDDWSAYTVAFHPAAPVTEGIEEDRSATAVVLPLPRRSNTLAALTIAVSLLQSTLAPLPPGAISTAVPAPARTNRALLTWTSTPFERTVSVPFAQTDWPVPASKPRLIVSMSSIPDDSTSSDAPFRGDGDSRLPRVPPDVRHLFLPFAPNLLNTTLGTPAAPAAPFLTPSVDLPRLRPTQPITWTTARPQYYQDGPTAFQPDLSLPLPRPRVLSPQYEQQSNLLVSTLAVPIGGSSTDLPKVGRANAVGWLQARPIFAVDSPTSFQPDLSLPAPRLRPQTLSWIQTRPIFAVDQSTAFAPEWPVPQPRKALRIHESAPTLLTGTLAVPVGASRTDLPRVGRANQVGWLQTRPVSAVDSPTSFQPDLSLPVLRVKRALPVDQANGLPLSVVAATMPAGGFVGDVPLRPRVLALSWIQTRPIFAVDEPTAFRPDWPVPVRVRRPVQRDHSDGLLLSTLAVPVGQTATALPARPRPALLEQASQNVALLATPPTPIVPILWAVPPRAVQPTLTWLQSRPIFAVDAMTTGAVHAALPPAARVRPGITWTSTVIAVEAAPVGTRATDNPTARAVQTLSIAGSIPTPLLDASATPPPAVAWALPRIRVAPAQSFEQPPSIALRESELPLIRQTDWPLPLRAGVPTLVWLQARPQYYRDVELPNVVLVEHEDTVGITIAHEATERISADEACSLGVAQESVVRVTIANEESVPLSAGDVAADICRCDLFVAGEDVVGITIANEEFWS